MLSQLHINADARAIGITADKYTDSTPLFRSQHHLSPVCNRHKAA